MIFETSVTYVTCVTPMTCDLCHTVSQCDTLTPQKCVKRGLLKKVGWEGGCFQGFLQTALLSAEGKNECGYFLQIFFIWNFGNIKTIQRIEETADDVADLINPKRIHNAMVRLLTGRIVDRHNPEYHVILPIGSRSHSDFKLVRNDWNCNPLEGHLSDPFWILYYQIGLDNNDLQL
jgi:hypothetical protein